MGGVRNPPLSEPHSDEDGDYRECDERLDNGSGYAAVSDYQPRESSHKPPTV